MTRDILMEELTPELVKRIAKALEINKHLTSTYALTVSVDDILSTDRNPDPSKSGFYFILEGTRSGVNFFYNNNLEFSRKPNSKSVRVVKRYNNLRGFEESFWLKWAEKWLRNPLTESVSETVKDKTGREFKISTEVFDSYGSQLYCGKIAHTGSTWLDENDRVKKSDLLGYIDYSVIDNVAYINMIEVKESERRKGIATELIKSMEKDYDKVQWGYTTDDGTALHKGIYGESLVEKIIKKSDGYYVTSEDGKKNLGGPYDTEDKAKRRLQQVHYFKNKDKKVNETEDRESEKDVFYPQFADQRRLDYLSVKKFNRGHNDGLDDAETKEYERLKKYFHREDESLAEGAEGRREPGYEYIIYDYTDEDGPNPIGAKRSTRTEAEYLAMRWMDNDYITHGRPHPKYKDRYLTFEKVPKGKFKVGDDFYGPFDADYNKLESVNEDKSEIEAYDSVYDPQRDNYYFVLPYKENKFKLKDIVTGHITFIDKGSPLWKRLRLKDKRAIREISNESLTESLDVDSLISQNLRPMQLFAKAFALDPHIRPDERGGQETLDKLFAYANNYFKEHPVKLEDIAHLEMLDQYDLDDDSIDVDLKNTEVYWPHEFNIADSVLEDGYSDEILVHKTDEPGVVYIVSEFEDGFTTMENLKKYFMDENTFNYNLQEYVKDYLGESLTEAKRYSPWDFGDEGGFFTREELDEFTSELQDITPNGVTVYKAYIDSNNILEVDWSYQDFEETSSMKIDMRKIKRPSDLINRYLSSFKFLIDSKVNEIEMEINESVNLKESSLVKDTVELGDGMLEWGWEKPNSYYVEKTYWTDKDNSLAKSDFKRYYISPEAAKAAFNRYKRKFAESSNRSIRRNKRLNESISWDYFDKFEDATQEYMPYSGEGETLASQLVTAINKLIYKWYNDGDVYDNRYTLEGWANDLSSYANWMSKYIDGAEDILSMIKTAEDSSDYEFILKLLADTFLGDKEYLDMLSEQPKDGSIYECSGKYKFIDRDNEDDFDYWDETDDEEDEDDDYYDDEEEEEEED